MTKISATEHCLDRVGSTLRCYEWGSGEPHLLFIHGLAGSHRQFAAQIECFAPRHRVVAVDLRGHGASEGPVEAPAIPTYAADTAAICEAIGLDSPVIVAHSMGGHVAGQLASDFPGHLSAVVFLDSSLVFAHDRLDSVRALVTALHGPHFQDAIRGFAEGLFAATDNPQTKDQILSDFCSLSQDVLAASAADVAQWKATDVLANCQAPTLYIGARDHPELAAVRDVLPTMEYGQVVGSGHFIHLEAADQVNSMIQRFLQIKGLTMTRDGTNR